jgi:hypothetical protein
MLPAHAHAQTAGSAIQLQMLGVGEYLQRRRAMGVVLLSVNWAQRANCSGFENAQLRGLVFDQVPTARGDDEPGDLVMDEPQAGIADYAFLAPPGAYALSGFDIKVVKSARDSGGFRAMRSRLLKDGFAVDGGFDVRAGEIVFIGEFSVECRRQPVPWRSYPDGPAEFQEYLARIKERFPALETGKAQFRPMMTRQFGAFYVPATVLKNSASRSIPELLQQASGGDPDSQYLLGMAYDVGNDVPRDIDEAIKWYLRAAQAGNLEAQYSVGSALQAEKRYAEARDWYEKAAAQGDPRGIAGVAALYDAGQGITQDHRKAYGLWTRAAEMGWAEAMWHLARVQAGGGLGERDFVAACAWNLRARGYAKPSERSLIARTEQTAALLEKNLHAGEVAACRTLAAQWVPNVRRD